jgi:hypothetical protein
MHEAWDPMLASTVLALGLSASAMAADINLTISSWLPPTHPINTDMLAGPRST